MLTLPAAIATAITSTTRRPAVRVTLLRDIPGYALLVSSSPAGEAFHNAICTAPDGSIVRAYMQNTAGSTAAQVYVQRVTSPSTPSQWTTWTALGSANKLRDAGITMGVVGSTISLFCCDGTNDNVFRSTSTDNGQTWSAFAQVAAIAGTETIRALCFAPGASTTGDPSCLFAIVDDGLLNATSNTVRVATDTGAGLGGFVKPVGTATGPSGAGVAAVRQSAGTFLVVPSIYALSQATGGGLALGSYVWSSSGATMTTSTVVVPNDDTSIAVSVQWPSLAIDGSGRLVLSYVEQDTGAYSGVVYARAVLAASLDGTHWEEGLDFAPMPLNAQSAVFEQPVCSTGGNVYVVDNGHVYQASTTVATLDVSSSVLRYSYTREAEQPSVLQLDLDNSAGTLLSAAAFGLNSRIKLEEGYVDGNGVAWYVTTNDHLLVRRYFAQRATHGQTPVNELQIEAEDSLCKLARESRHDWVYQNQTLGWLASEIVARAGAAPATIPGTAQFSNTIAVFRVAEGNVWSAALGRLLGIFGSWYRATSTGGVTIQELQSADASVWTYTTSDLESCRWGSVGDRDNHARVYGKPPAGVATLPVGESWDWIHVNTTWERRYRHVVEQAVATAALAASRAGFELADRLRKAALHAVQVCHNPGLELYDVVTVTDAPAGVNAALYRVMGAVTRFDAQAAEFSLQLQLEGV